ncbi:hypothetical protein E4U17_007790 [Claviceps sp. LM77 group G4]|nr:hypothetical protein E4U17_007790 [Claviceps sp. LM77 group G4]KAG6069700.1 hypothetical protein E4U16_007480 [Claviceps sp. LM84 group G4]
MAASMGTATGPAKLQAVTDLVNKLSDDVEQTSLLPKDRNDALQELKIFGRDPKDADPIFTEKGMTMLLRYAFHSDSSETAREALRVVSNAMLLKSETRQMFIRQGYAAQACDQLSSESWDDEFLLSRILFLCTYGTDIDFKALIEDHQLANHTIYNLERHITLPVMKKTQGRDPMEQMALVETLKLMFNASYFCKAKVSAFTPAVSIITSLLCKPDVSDANPLEPPFSPLVNSLLNLDIQADESRSSLYPDDAPCRVTSRIVNLLDRGLRAYSGNDLETLVTPVVSLLSRLYENAPLDVRQAMKEVLLPTVEDRQVVLGHGESLASKLLNNSTNPTAPALRDAISHLLFDLSDKDASTFVENVGYGFASGFLFQNNLPVPSSFSSGLSRGEASRGQKPVNPITGQFLDEEKLANVPDLTEEEKQREAERLFVLFERLKKTGIISMQNPVEKAVQEGRFEELSDDYVEELD